MSAPLVAGYRFVVELDSPTTYIPRDQAELVPNVGNEDGFQEVTGLGAELETMPYPEGGMNAFTHQLPVRHKWNNLTLKRGVISTRALWLWYQAGLTQSLGARRDGTIALMHPDGEIAITWGFLGGLAVKWNGPDLNAMDGSIAVESIEIAHQGVYEIPS